MRVLMLKRASARNRSALVPEELCVSHAHYLMRAGELLVCRVFLLCCELNFQLASLP